MGLGKTKIILDVLSLDNKRVLALSPSVATVSTWADEINKHSNKTYIELTGTTPERWKKLLESEAEIVLLNYTGLLVMNTVNSGGRWVIDFPVLAKFTSLFDCVVFDEIHLCKNHRSLTFKVCKYIAEHTKYRYGLTGTPLNRDPMSLWSQFYLIDLGETLGRHISIYREAFFTQYTNYWGALDYKFKKIYTEHLNKRVRNKSIRFVKEDTLDLPDKVFTKIPVELSDEARKVYLDIVYNSDIKDIKQTFPKLRQICSGFFEDIVFETQKLDELVDLIKSIPTDSKVVVFLEFIKSGELVTTRLKKEGIRCERLYGGTRDKIGVKNNFLKNENIKVLVANVESGGVGLNLQVANYVVFYELPLSSIDYRQAVERVHRPGQNNTVFVYSLITKNTVEEKIENYLQEGKDIFKALIDGNKAKEILGI